MGIDVVVFRITGISPLMQSNPILFITDGSEPENGDEGDEKALKKTKTVYDPEQEAAMRCYPKSWSKDFKKAHGPFLHPAAAFRRSMMNAVSGMKFVKKTARMVLAGACFPVEEWVTLLDKKGNELTEYELDKRSVVIKSGGKRNRILRVRPKFPEWMCDLPLEIDREWLRDKDVLASLTRAGRIIGVGEFRPDPSDGKSGIGTFGRFTAEVFKV